MVDTGRSGMSVVRLFLQERLNLHCEEQDVMPLGKWERLITPASAAAPWAPGEDGQIPWPCQARAASRRLYWQEPPPDYPHAPYSRAILAPQPQRPDLRCFNK